MDRTSGTALVPAGEFGPLDGLSEAVHTLYIDGFAEQCVAESHRWESVALAVGDTATHRYLQYTRSIALQQLGRHDDAVATARTLLAGLEDHEAAWRAKALSIIAEGSTRAGRPGRALSALAEADWLCSTLTPGTYGQMSATMAVALALRSLELFEQADERLRGREFRAGPEVRMLATQERAELSATWGVSLLLTGSEGSGHQFRRTAELGTLLQRTAAALGNTAMAARGAIFEAYALMQLGHPDLAEARALAVRDWYPHRPELLETQLDRFVHAYAAVRRGRFDDGRKLLEQVTRDTHPQSRGVWLTYAHGALAHVDTSRHGRTLAGELWRREATRAMQRLWAERDARFEALRDREAVRRLTAETDRMGRVMLQDPMTGLGNRLMLQATLDSRPQPPAVVFIDVDQFKAVNDRFTHATGDHVLTRLGHVLRAQCRADDVVIRYGGDEFLVLTSAEDRRAETIAHRIQRAVGEIDWSDLAEGLHITVSVGVGYPTVDASADAVDGPGTADATGGVGRPKHNGATLSSVALALADAALLDAKRNGRDRVVTR